MNADRFPRLALLTSMVLTFTLFAGVGSELPTPAVAADEKPDPWVGTYVVYERGADGVYHPSKRHQGKVTITRADDFYTVDFAPKVRLRKVNERLLDAGDTSGHPRRVELRVEDGQSVLEVQSSFHSIHLIQGKVPKTWKVAAPVQDKAPRLPEASKWDLTRDYKIDGKLEDNQNIQQTPLTLLVQGNQLSGHYLDRKAGGENNNSTFSGEIVTREKSLLILRQEGKKDGTYVVIHTGHQIGENHYRGTWHDNSGQSGDFELKIAK